jgi:DNA replication protein DnaC
MMDNHGYGLFLMGGVGVGKTLFTTRVYPRFLLDVFGKRIKVVSAMEMNETIESLLYKKLLIVDDIGSEQKYQHYGNEIEGFSRLVDLAERDYRIIIATSNLGGKEIVERYGRRVADRINAICIKIDLTINKSFRTI